MFRIVQCFISLSLELGSQLLPGFRSKEKTCESTQDSSDQKSSQKSTLIAFMV